MKRFGSNQAEEVRQEVIKKWAIASCALLLTLSMLVPAGCAASFHMKQYSGYKTFSPWGAWGEVRIDAVVEVVTGPVDPSKVTWNIGFWGGGLSFWVWVDNGEWVEYPAGMGNAYAYYYGGKFYVTWATYKWSISQYDGFEYYSIYFYYNGAPVASALWKWLVEIPWP